LIAGILAVSAVLAEEAKPFDPDFSEMTEIMVSHNGWLGRFALDGMATLQKFGASPPDLFWDMAVAPERSFSFEEIYSLVAPYLKPVPVPKSGEYLSIVFEFGYFPDASDRIPAIYLCIENKKVMRTLMYGLRDKVVPHSGGARAFFEGLLSKYPLVPGDKPTPFAYGWDDEAFLVALTNAHSIKSEEAQELISKAFQEPSAEEELARAAELARWKAFYETPREIPDDEEDESEETPTPPSNRPWLYAVILSALCAGAVIWFIRRKRK